MRPLLHDLAVVAFGCLLLIACEREPSVGDTGTIVDTLASKTLGTSSQATGPWNKADTWRIEEDLRIGALEGDGANVLGRIGALEVDSDGNILVFDNLANELRVFSGHGDHQRTIGRRGSGPGEFRAVIGMALSPEGRLLIVDSRNARYTVVSRDGELSSLRRASRVGARPWVGGFDLDGQFYDLAIEATNDGLMDIMLQVNMNGDIVRSHPIPRIEAQIVQLTDDGISTDLPFAAKVLRVWDPRGAVWQALSSEYRITRIDLDGDAAIVASREYKPVPLTAMQADSIDAAARRIMAQFGHRVSAKQRPTAIAPLRWFITDDEGRLWVCATALEPCTKLDVFDTDGVFLSTISLPSPVLDFPLPVIRNGRFYAAAEGMMGEPQVFVGRIKAP